MAKVTGIGGIFFKSRNNAEQLSAWYQEHLGLNLEDFGGVVLQWQEDKAEDQGLTVWKVADKESSWFDAPFMINYRVDDMGGMIEQLKKAGVEILKGPESHENGKFAWILDPEGNKVELWEPKLWDEKNKG